MNWRRWVGNGCVQVEFFSSSVDWRRDFFEKFMENGIYKKLCMDFNFLHQNKLSFNSIFSWTFWNIVSTALPPFYSAWTHFWSICRFLFWAPMIHITTSLWLSPFSFTFCFETAMQLSFHLASDPLVKL